MSWFKRIFLFTVVNVLVMITVSFILNLLGVGRNVYSGSGLNYESLAVLCLVWGMVGSLISLALSRIMAKTIMGVEVIDPETRDPALLDLVRTVHSLAREAGLPKMPEVGIYDSPDVNAFATGPTKSRALVAVSTGLMSRMNSSEVRGVLGHEIAHIANGDMVTMTLLQGVINAFVLFLSRVLAFFISQALRNDDREERGGGHWVEFILTPIFQILFSILGSIVVSWFSRWREFRADAGGARLAGRERMIAALQALQRIYELPEAAALGAEARTPEQFKTLQISAHKGLALFSTHPSLEDRIARLRQASGPA